MFAIINHVRGYHGIDVKNGNSHYAHCNDCPRTNGHGRRLSSEEAVIDHLLEDHGVSISRF